MSLDEALHYPPPALLGDYTRGTIGALATGLPVLLTDGVLWVEVLLGGIAVLCLWFLIRTVERHTQRVRLDDTGLRLSGWRSCSVGWDQLQAMTLRYYTTKRDRTGGWMQLVLRGPEGRIEVDSRLVGFAGVVQAAHRAAMARDLLLSPATLANLEHLGEV
ncbi:MAG: hypothetical protein EAZ99_18780 [Alphaproteobacteria bacterium]|nr:MAG: hypothetical protein EAZ99_18780 [Alphaproteobacteria bacterium]